VQRSAQAEAQQDHQKPERHDRLKPHRQPHRRQVEESEPDRGGQSHADTAHAGEEVGEMVGEPVGHERDADRDRRERRPDAEESDRRRQDLARGDVEGSGHRHRAPDGRADHRGRAGGGARDQIRDEPTGTGLRGELPGQDEDRGADDVPDQGEHGAAQADVAGGRSRGDLTALRAVRPSERAIRTETPWPATAFSSSAEASTSAS
jgi:hypothetical protein